MEEEIIRKFREQAAGRHPISQIRTVAGRIWVHEFVLNEVAKQVYTVPKRRAMGLNMEKWEEIALADDPLEKAEELFPVDTLGRGESIFLKMVIVWVALHMTPGVRPELFDIGIGATGYSQEYLEHTAIEVAETIGTVLGDIRIHLNRQSVIDTVFPVLSEFRRIDVLLSIYQDVHKFVKDIYNLDEMGRCPECNHLVINRSIQRVAGGRRNAGILLCEECRAHHRWCPGCNNHIDDRAAEDFILDDVMYCPSCYEDLGGNEREGDVFGYHSGKGRNDFSEGSRLKIGFEVEKEDRSIRSKIKAKFLLRTTGWVVERDASLNSDTGYEAISPILPLDGNKSHILTENLQKVHMLINASHTRKCGGHVHLSDTQRTPREILIDIQGYFPLLYAMYPRRVENTYCEGKSFAEYWMYAENHRRAIHVTDRTLEIRLFPSPKSVKSLEFRAAFIRHMLEVPRYSLREVIDDITSKKRLYKILRKMYTEEEIAEKLDQTIEYGKKFTAISRVFTSKKVENFKKNIQAKKDDSQMMLEIATETRIAVSIKERDDTFDPMAEVT